MKPHCWRKNNFEEPDILYEHPMGAVNVSATIRKVLKEWGSPASGQQTAQQADFIAEIISYLINGPVPEPDIDEDNIQHWLLPDLPDDYENVDSFYGRNIKKED